MEITTLNKDMKRVILKRKKGGGPPKIDSGNKGSPSNNLPTKNQMQGHFFYV